MKKSRFITTIFPSDTENAALNFIEYMKKKYWDASHNCFAYVINPEQPLMRCSDDGEPAKTAGKPILDILISHDLTNLAVVVTRYFGGTLLGTGGLVRAYQSAVIEGLNNSTVITKELGVKVSISTDYSLIGKLQYYISQETFPVLSSSYTELVSMEILVPLCKYQLFTKKAAELTNGSADLQELERVYYARLGNQVHLFSS